MLIWHDTYITPILLCISCHFELLVLIVLLYIQITDKAN